MAYTGYGGANRKGAFDDNINLVSGPPPPYEYSTSARRSRWDPRGWSRRSLILSVVGIVIVLIIIIAVATVEARNGRYPDYSKLSYQLQETCKISYLRRVDYWLIDTNQTDEGSTFFDNFNYFTGYDPSQGFVQ